VVPQKRSERSNVTGGRMIMQAQLVPYVSQRLCWLHHRVPSHSEEILIMSTEI